MKFKFLSLLFIVNFFAIGACEQKKLSAENQTVTKDPATWAERLGYPQGKKVIMLHADDAGMCEEANIATKQYLLDEYIQSTAVMPPCPQFEDMIEWAKEHPDIDVGLHLTLTSEWKTYRWPSVSPIEEVPSLIDDEGKLWHEVPDVVQHANVDEVAIELRAQIEKSLALGYRPDHIDTHMGTLYGHPEYAKAYMNIAMEYGIPAMVIDMNNPEIVQRYREIGYPINEDMIKFIDAYKLPKLDNFTSAPNTDSYASKVQAFKDLITSLRPGLTEIIFHPSVESDQLKSITGSWQQRVWEAQMFADPDLIQFFKDQEIIFTNWKEIMKRFKKLNEVVS